MNRNEKMLAVIPTIMLGIIIIAMMAKGFDLKKSNEILTENCSTLLQKNKTLIESFIKNDSINKVIFYHAVRNSYLRGALNILENDGEFDVEKSYTDFEEILNLAKL
jgi:uncharacterized membrane protein required for colicin V production